MKCRWQWSFAVATVLFGLYAVPVQAKLSDAQVKERIIQQSIEAYPGNCPCPYNTMRNGRSCGRRSAWSRPGGESPVCYKDDVTREMIQRWREENET